MVFYYLKRTCQVGFTHPAGPIALDSSLNDYTRIIFIHVHAHVNTTPSGPALSTFL